MVLLSNSITPEYPQVEPAAVGIPFGDLISAAVDHSDHRLLPFFKFKVHTPFTAVFGNGKADILRCFRDLFRFNGESAFEEHG